MRMFTSGCPGYMPVAAPPERPSGHLSVATGGCRALRQRPTGRE